MSPDYGQPDKNDLPIIVAAHRFGYVYWDRETRNRVSFFRLPDTKVGDEIEIIWNQRRYVYEIYAEDESTYIKDYEADLILYTCKYFNSPQRIFRYATRIN
jgi:sortase (surface protein transpeptidase)